MDRGLEQKNVEYDTHHKCSLRCYNCLFFFIVFPFSLIPYLSFRMSLGGWLAVGGGKVHGKQKYKILLFISWKNRFGLLNKIGFFVFFFVTLEGCVAFGSI